MTTAAVVLICVWLAGMFLACAVLYDRHGNERRRQARIEEAHARLTATLAARDAAIEQTVAEFRAEMEVEL